jgi:hypothetical protein
MSNTAQDTQIDFSQFRFPKLAESVVEQMGGEESFFESWKDVVNHGISGGFHGFIYYTETNEFARRHLADIRQLAKETSDAFGIGMIEMIQNFRCLEGDYTWYEIGETLYGAADDVQILNALAWFAAEEVCREFETMQQD